MTLLAVHLALTAAYAGFQWTVRALVYPQFALVPPTVFPAYERRHQERITRVVGPLFAGQGVTTAWLLAARPVGTSLVPVTLTGISPARPAAGERYRSARGRRGPPSGRTASARR